MRRLSKPWPPADVSPAGRPARSFSDAEHEYLGDLPNATDQTAFARTSFDQFEKSKLRNVLYREQRNLCAYCETPIKEGHPAPPIDHWRPLKLNPELALHWKNLYLTCTNPETCDSNKSSNPLKWREEDPDLPWPTAFKYEAVVGFSSLGEMYVRNDVVLEEATRQALQLAIDDQPDGNRMRKAILNLNHPALVAARAAAIDSEQTRLETDFEGKTATRDERAERAHSLLNKNRLPKYISIRVCWLRKTLGKGR